MKKTLGAILFGILAVVIVSFGIFSLVDRNDPSLGVDSDPSDYGTDASKKLTDIFSTSDEQTDASSSASDGATKGSTPSVSEYAYAYAGFSPEYANMTVADWRMILVNRDYILPDGYKPQLENAVESGYDDVYLDERVAPYYNEMYKAAYKDGIHLVPISGYRSVDRQKRNFENKIDYYMDKGYSKVEATQEAATIILPPGTSEHNAGLAMDICSLEQNFEDTEEFEWLCENAADYGFILRYPEDKQDITKIIYEPWHWRYVGVEAAKEMKASGECLEEYLGVA